jgi:sugar lactone lactonase YvrE
VTRDPETQMLLEGLTFPESPHWRDGRLWFSDFYSHRVLAVDLEGHAETIAEVPRRPSRLGWRPNGTMLVVSMLDRCLLERVGGGLRAPPICRTSQPAPATTWWSTR